jgi:hypothetical protein
MTPQAMLKVRFAELAESLHVKVSSRRQGGKFYFSLTGAWQDTRQFIANTFPGAWITSSGGDTTYGLPLGDVNRILAELGTDPAWLQRNEAAALRLAQAIREDRAFERLPVLADALEEAGCDNAKLLSHCREGAPHGQTCWVVELLLGPERKRGKHLREA